MFITSCSSIDKRLTNYKPSKLELEKAKEIAYETADWFEYTTGPMKSKNLGQCSDYAVMFILKFNQFIGKNIARLVIANNPITSGTYKIGDKVDVGKLGFNGFSSGSSGILNWDGELYIYHPIHGAYQISLEKSWTPKKHFGVNMLDSKQVHAWASIGEISVDPTYYDVYPDRFGSSPLGRDE